MKRLAGFVKKLLASPTKLGFIGVFVVFALPLVYSANASALQMDLEWVDAAHIQINSIKVEPGDGDGKDGRPEFSDETNQYGLDKVNEWLNNQYKGKTFSYPDLLEQRNPSVNANYHIDVCGAKEPAGLNPGKSSAGTLDLGGGQLDSGATGDFVIGLFSYATEGSAKGGCHFITKGGPQFGDNKINVPIKKAERRNIWFNATNANTLVRVDGKDGNFIREGQTAQFIRQENRGSGSCPNSDAHVEVPGGEITGGIISANYETCDKYGRFAVDISGIKDQEDQPETPGSGATPDNPTCESNGGLSWVVCPAVNGLADAADGIFKGLILPLLRNHTDVTDPNSSTFKVWVAMRNIANVFLVIAMLVIVFGQTIGGGLVDAYTAKKVLPRILAAVILINLSLYIVALCVDITQIVGEGISNLLYAPFQQAGAFKIRISEVTGGFTILGTLTGLFTAGALVAGGFSITGALPFIALFIVLPAVLAFLGVLFTLILRQGLIYFLVVSSPVAFALYCLPNTEKYFRKWWDLFVKTLLVFPIIMIIFAMADVLSVTTGVATQNDSGTVDALANLIGIVLLVLPMFLIPYAFKMAGGAIGAVHGVLTSSSKKGVEGIKGNANDPNSLRNRSKRNFGAEATKARAQFVRRNKEKRGWRSFGMGALGRRMDYGNVLDKEAEINEDAQRRLGRTTGAGDDTYVRARTSLALYEKDGGGQTTKKSEARVGADGRAVRVTDAKGNAMRASMNGQKRYTDYDYEKSKQLYRTQGELQEAVNYEAKKTLTDQDTDTFLDSYGDWAEQEGLELEQAKGMFTGVAFARQGERLELKHSSVESDGAGGYRVVAASANDGSKIDSTTGEVSQLGGRDAFVQELYDKKGSWAVSQMHDSTINQVAEAKEGYAEEIRDLVGKQASGATLTAEEQGRLDLSRKQLSQIQEMEDTWVADPNRSVGGGPVATIDDEGTPGYSGLSGAASGVQKAARESALRDAVDPTTGAALTRPDGSTVKVRKTYDNNGQLTWQKVPPAAPGGPHGWG